MVASLHSWWSARVGHELLGGEPEEVPMVVCRPRRRLALAAAAVGALLLVGVVVATTGSASQPEAAKLGSLGHKPELEAIAVAYDALPSSLFERAGALPEPPAVRGLVDSAASTSVDPWRVTDCVIDIDQATGFLMLSVVLMWKAVDYDPTKCPDSETVCAEMVSGFVGSLAIATTFVSLAVSSCPAYMPANSAALCSSDWSALVSMFSFMVFAGAGMRDDCNFENTTADYIVSGMTDTGAGIKDKYESKYGKLATEGSRASEPSGLAGQVKKLKAKYLDAKQKYAGGLKKFYETAEAAQDSKRARQFSQVACATDVMESLGYTIRAITQLRAAAVACPDPKLCAIDIVSMIGSVNFVATFIAFAINDCPLDQNKMVAQNAACSSDITLMIGTTTTAAAVATATTVDCVSSPDQAGQ